MIEHRFDEIEYFSSTTFASSVELCELCFVSRKIEFFFIYFHINSRSTIQYSNIECDSRRMWMLTICNFSTSSAYDSKVVIGTTSPALYKFFNFNFFSSVL